MFIILITFMAGPPNRYEALKMCTGEYGQTKIECGGVKSKDCIFQIDAKAVVGLKMTSKLDQTEGNRSVLA